MIPKGTLTKIKKISFMLLWFGSHSSRGLPLVKWSGIGTPKNLGGWGLKNIFHFTQSLAA
jgi:hypothetical protein